MNRVLFVVGALLVVVALVYFVVPASSLPAVFPGADPGLTRMHYKHGGVALFLATACFVYGWFRSRRT